MSSPARPAPTVTQTQPVATAQAETPPQDLAHAETIQRKIKNWADALLDFTGRNPLLNYRTPRSAIPVCEPTPAIVAQELLNGGPLNFLPMPEPVEGEDEPEAVHPGFGELATTLPQDRLKSASRTLARRERTSQEEAGISVLYAVFGWLKWRIPDKGLMTSPLVLVPVQLLRTGVGAPYRLSHKEDEIILNPTLCSYLREREGIVLPAISEDAEAQDIISHLEAVAQAISTRKDWRVERSGVHITALSFHQQVIVDDLLSHADLLAENPLVQTMALGSDCPWNGLTFDMPDRELDRHVRPCTTHQVLDADSSQQLAIEAAKAGESFVLQGPPGTGKSQTIANIIAECLAMGRRVLFVSAKAAALEVVLKRLQSVGLERLCLQAHSHKRDKKQVIKDLIEAQTSREDSIPDVSQLQAQLQATRVKLNGYVEALTTKRFALNWTARDILARQARLAGTPDVYFDIPSAEALTTEEYDHISMLLKRLASDFGHIVEHPQEHPWYGVRSEGIPGSERARFLMAGEQAGDTLGDVALYGQTIARAYGVQAPTTLDEARQLVNLASKVRPGLLQYAGLDTFEHEFRFFWRRWGHRYKDFLAGLDELLWEPQGIQYGHGCTLADLATDMRQVLSVTGEAGEIELALIESYTDSIDQAEEQLKAWNEYLAPEARLDTSAPLDDLLDAIEGRMAYSDRLGEWLDFASLYAAACSTRLQPMLQTLRGRQPCSTWPALFEHRLTLLLWDRAQAADDRLQDAELQIHQEMVEAFQKLDEKLIELAPACLLAQGTLERQEQLFESRSSEVTILRREANKKRRVMPLRRLFSSMPNLITSLKPCLMMSPMTVSQLLDPECYHFDLVIFDEASQLRAEEAVGAIMRADQVIVAGDKQQLPPTSFFQAAEVEGDEEMDTFESILHEADAAGLTNRMLMWHYRSKNEELIAFSNHHWYDDKLYTFPCQLRGEDGRAVTLDYVEGGIYGRGTSQRNEVEAAHVVELIIAHYKAHPDESLGVVTFNTAQRNCILDMLEDRLASEPDVAPFFQTEELAEAPFVKNLETVQGDERDVMMFSIGYGRGQDGRLSMNFGPLNRQGGDKRLNVAITRARQRVIIVSSILPEDIKSQLRNTTSLGPRLLADYMTFARDGAAALDAEATLIRAGDTPTVFDSSLEECIYEALSERGLKLDTQVGVSSYRIDLGVVHPADPGRYILGIECDGAAYHSSPTARDRDRLRQQVLESKGWHIHRIWSPDWVRDPNREIERVLDKVQRLQEGQSAPPERVTRAALMPRVKTIHIEREDPVKPYITARPDKYYDPETFYYDTRGVGKAVVEVITQEGPIHIDLLTQRIAKDYYGFARAGSKIRARIQSIVKRKARSKQLSMSKDIVRLANQAFVLREAGGRKPGQIAAEELSMAIVSCVRQAFGLNRDELPNAVARLMGFKSTTKVLRARVDAVTEILVEHKVLVDNDGKISLK